MAYKQASSRPVAEGGLGNNGAGGAGSLCAMGNNATQIATTGFSTAGNILKSNGATSLPIWSPLAYTAEASVLAEVNSQLNDVTGNNTTYLIPYQSTPIQSPSGFYSAPTFTIPVEGWYIMNMQVDMAQVTTSAGTIQIYANGSLPFMGALFSGGSFVDGTNLSLSTSVLRYAAASNTTVGTVIVAGLALQVDLPANTNKFALVNIAV